MLDNKMKSLLVTKILIAIGEEQLAATTISNRLNAFYSMIFTQLTDEKSSLKKYVIPKITREGKKKKTMYKVNWEKLSYELLDFIKEENPKLKSRVEKRFYGNNELITFLKKFFSKFHEKPKVEFTLFDMFKKLTEKDYSQVYKIKQGSDSKDFSEILKLLYECRPEEKSSQLDNTINEILSEN